MKIKDLYNVFCMATSVKVYKAENEITLPNTTLYDLMQHNKNGEIDIDYLSIDNNVLIITI